MGLGGDDALRSQMMESMPLVEQINKEFRDPVSTHTHTHTHTHTQTHVISSSCMYVCNDIVL